MQAKHIFNILLLLGSQFLGLCLFKLGDLGQGLVAQTGASPVLPDLLRPLIEVGLDGLNKLVQGTLVLGLYLKRNGNFVNSSSRYRRNMVCSITLGFQWGIGYQTI